MDLFSLIESKMPEFSKGQKLIANYILKDYDKAAYMTASKLGATVGISESTVVRFAMELGFEGYPELQLALQSIIRNRLTAVQRIEVAKSRMGDGDILTSVLNSDIEKLRITLEGQDRAQFTAVVNSIIKAKKIYILGVRSSASLASFMAFNFNLLFDNVKLIDATSASEMFEQMLRITEKDLMIGISFPRYSKRTVKALQYSHDNGATVVAITDSASSPLAPYADHLLTARSDMASFVDSLVAPLSLINALIVAISLIKKDEISETFSRLEHIWDEYEVYEKSNGQK